MKKKASKFVTEMTRLVFKPFARLRYGFKFKFYKEIKSPCLIITNHVTIDPLFVGCSFSFPINYVASDLLTRHKSVAKLLTFLIQPIYITKSVSDTRAVMDIFSVIKQGGSVCLFPEGNRTMNGATVNIPPAIKKLIKKLHVPVVIAQFKGAYFCNPRWGKTIRRGVKGDRPTLEIERVISPEEQDNYDADQLFDIVKKSLYYNAYEDQAKNPQRYKGRKKAEFIERVLFVCPECHKMAMYSKGNFFGCKHCGMKLEYTEYGDFKPVNAKHSLKTIYDWDKWQIDHLSRLDYAAKTDDDVITSDNGIMFLNISKMQRRDIVGKKGGLGLFKKRLIYTYGKRKTVGVLDINLDDITSATIQGKARLTLYLSDGRAYLVDFPENVSPYKYMILIYRLKAHNNNKEFDFYGI